MRPQLRQLRHEVTGRARTRATHAITGLPQDRRLALAGRVRRNPLSRAALGAAAEWYGRAPIHIASGPAQGLQVSTEHFGLEHEHAGLIVRGTLELGVQEALRRTVAPGDTVYDIGANIGYFTLVAARLTGPGGRVIAFEPVPWCAEAVARNIALNGLEHASIRAEAVGAETGRTRLMVVEEASWSHLEVTGHHADTRERIDVDVTALDDLIGSGTIPPPDVLKIDTEGAELLVVEGMRGTIDAHRPKLICELHDTNDEFAALMDGIGYRTSNLDGPSPIREAGPGVHVLAEPRD